MKESTTISQNEDDELICVKKTPKRGESGKSDSDKTVKHEMMRVEMAVGSGARPKQMSSKYSKEVGKILRYTD